ncbi:tRNA (adenine-N1)-methyltransferase [Salana multivorans]
MRRGPFRWGDRVQLTDPRGRPSTITLTPGGSFQTHKGYFRHEELEGKPEGSVVETTKGVAYLALRPLLADYVLSMPRGAAVVYPKDAGQIVTMADIYPGARVVEAGVGSGGLTMSLLRAIGDGGSLLSIERRADFAEIAIANVEGFFGGEHPAWEVAVGDFADVLGELREPGSVDRIVLDMLAPWENLHAAATALAPGGVFLAYVATATQLSRTAEDLRADGRFTEPVAWESMVRGWHLEGLAVRPEHRMVGHTGFLLTARRLGPGVEPPERRRRPQASAAATDPEEVAKLAADAARVQIGDEYGPEDFGERGATAKKTRRVARDAGVIRRAAERSALAAASDAGSATGVGSGTDDGPGMDDDDGQGPAQAPTLDVTAPPEEGR